MQISSDNYDAVQVWLLLLFLSSSSLLLL